MLRFIARVLTDKFFSRPSQEFLDERLDKMLRHLRETGRAAAADRFLRYEEETERLEHRDIEIEACDGAKLHGVLYPTEKPCNVYVVTVHGYRSSTEKDFALQFDYLRSLGFNVLTVDQRAHGKSGGDYICLGVKERHDLVSWLNTVKEIDHSAVFVLYGISMGSSTVLASLEIIANGECSVKERDIKAVVADCGYVSPDRQLMFMARRRTRLPVKGILSAARKELLRKAGFDINAFDTASILKEVSVPVLFVHGKKDRFVPIEFSYENYNACASGYKRLLEVPDASHAGAYIRAEEAYKAEITSLLDAAGLM
ncbi:MAG: alpha/beta hydrolase [Clostridia bacterium]|nr:alpha/beta hydrolase [Clostridia bacterium]